jgi:hypothetical protein
VTTKADFRDLLRRTLEDTSVSAPLWDDTTLDDATAEGLTRYSALVPLEQRSSVIVAEADTQIAVPGLESGVWIEAIRDPTGRFIEPIGVDDRIPAQGWRWWNGAIQLARPASAGSWSVDWRAPRLMPPLDADDVPIRTGDEGAVSLMAAASALRRRAVEEAKRGSKSGDALLILALQCERDGDRLARSRGRQVRGSFARKG